MSVKVKISKAKRNNQKKNKLIKQGVIKKGAKKINKHLKDIPGKPPKKTPQEDVSEEESDHGEDMLQMVDEDDLAFLKNAITKRSYSILNKVKYSGPIQKTKKRKNAADDDTLENEYEDQIEDTSGKRIKTMLPIKTQKGLVHKEIVEDISDDENEEPNKNENHSAEADEDQNLSDVEEDFTLHETDIDLSKPISAAQLLVTRNETLRQKKIHIGTLSSGLLENPEEKITNLRTLLKLMDDQTSEVYFTARKLVIVSMLEVFKDILPSYEIKNLNPEGVKLKKDTLKLQKYEENLLLYYKKFLQKLEKYCFLLVKKKGDSRKISEEETKLSELSIQAMCDLLVSHPYFNYAQNVAQVLVPFLNNRRKNVRELVKNSIKTVFKEDKKEEVTLKILRLVNNFLKTHSHNVNIDILEILLVLNLRDVNLDQEKEQDIKNKKLEAKKSRLLQMSKREKKRKKRLQELESEMLETKAEESRQVKQKNLTEITKIVFNIYFRILKKSDNTKLLRMCLEGLAKFAHCINLEYYIDIVNALNKLLNEDWLGYREQLHCIQTIFIMLSGQGEAINIDPNRFYVNLYKDLLITNAGKNHENSSVVIKTLVDSLIKRRKRITNRRIINFVKRLATLSLQLLHNGSLGCLGLIKTLMQLNRSVDILLDLDSSGGEGKYQPQIEDPEYANAANSALFETVLLSRHYHPVVTRFARNIASGVPASGDGSLPAEYGKLTIEQLYTDFSMSEMAFNPSIPVPKKAHAKVRSNKKDFADISFYEECKVALQKRQERRPFWITVGVEDVYILSESLIHTIDFVGYVVVCQHYHRNHKSIRSLITDFEIFNTFCDKAVIEKVDNKFTKYTKWLLIYVLPGLAFNSVWPLFTKSSCLKTAPEYYKKHDPCGMPTHNWYPFDASKPAFYWVAYFIEANVINSVVMGFVFGPVTVGGLLMHIIAQLENCKKTMIDTVNKSETLDQEEAIEQQLKFCIRYHQTILAYAKKVFQVFGHMLIVYMTMASFTLAAITYQVVVLDQNVQDRLRYCMLLLGWIILFFMICYGGQKITDESLDLSQAIYKSNWYNVPVNLRKYVEIMMMRAQKPLHLRAEYVGIFSLPLFIHVLKTAYSAFSLLLTITDGKN